MKNFRTIVKKILLVSCGIVLYLIVYWIGLFVIGLLQ